MNKILISIFKVLFWAYFMYCTGIVQGIVSLESKSSSDIFDDEVVTKQMPYSEMIKLEGKMHQMYEQRVVAAKSRVKNGGVYSPYDYFTDMRDINEFRKEYGIVMRPTYFELREYSSRSIKKGQYTMEDVEKARDIAFPGSYAEEIERRKNPTSWVEIFSRLGRWCLGLYLKMLPAVFLLFLIWIYEQNGRKGLRLRNPISFLISLLFHPIVIFLAIREWWVEKGRSLVAAVEIRRTKEQAFSLLTKDELSLIRQFAKRHITYKELRLKLGDVSYLRHTFVAALLVTLILQCIPRSVALVAAPSDEHKVMTTYHATSSYGSFSEESLEQGAVHEWPFLVSQYSQIPPLLITIKRWHSRVTSYLLSQGYIRCIEHVPLVVNSFFMQVNKYVNQNNRYEQHQSTYRAFPYKFSLFHRADQKHPFSW